LDLYGDSGFRVIPQHPSFSPVYFRPMEFSDDKNRFCVVLGGMGGEVPVAYGGTNKETACRVALELAEQYISEASKDAGKSQYLDRTRFSEGELVNISESK